MMLALERRYAEDTLLEAIVFTLQHRIMSQDWDENTRELRSHLVNN